MTNPVKTQVVGRLGEHPDRPGRLALFHADGAVSNYFGTDETRGDVARVLARAGLRLLDNNDVVISAK